MKDSNFNSTVHIKQFMSKETERIGSPAADIEPLLRKSIKRKLLVSMDKEGLSSKEISFSEAKASSSSVSNSRGRKGGKSKKKKETSQPKRRTPKIKGNVDNNRTLIIFEDKKEVG